MIKRALFTLASITLLAASSFAASPAKEAFDRLKKLEGSWAGKGDDAVKVIYKITGGGSAIVETELPGTAGEMVTVYHMDGDNLLMTHYCAAHNQPHMKLVPGKDASVLHFEFVSGTNMKPSDGHMHRLMYHLVDANHVVTEWTFFSKGKDAGSAKFDLHRVKVS